MLKHPPELPSTVTTVIIFRLLALEKQTGVNSCYERSVLHNSINYLARLSPWGVVLFAEVQVHDFLSLKQALIKFTAHLPPLLMPS